MVIVFGRYGQVAQALYKRNPNWLFYSSQEAPFTEPQKVLALLEQHKPNIIINAAAYTAVDKAESEKETALQVNAHTVGKIAHWCSTNNATLIHYSTDYVFDGSGDQPWIESDTPHPINWYGHTKLEGEKLIQASGCQYYIFRVSWVYSEWGKNFKKTILQLAQEREEIRIVSDQWGAPTDANDIAKSTTTLVDHLIQKDSAVLPFGLYHWVFAAYTNWYEFALNIIASAKKEGLSLKVKTVTPISTEDYPTPAKRPKNSRLGTSFSAAKI